MVVSGMPMRIQGFVLRQDPLAAADWFRKSMGSPLMEDVIGNKLILGRGEGNFYITVQLEPAGPDGKSTRGTVAVTNLKASQEKYADTVAVNARLLSRLPGGSRLLNQVSSSDHGKMSSYVVAENGHSETLNRDRLVESLRADGYTLERETRLDQKSASALPDPIRKGRSLFFRGVGKEAIVVIQPSGAGKTAIVFNTVTTMERVK